MGEIPFKTNTNISSRLHRFFMVFEDILEKITYSNYSETSCKNSKKEDSYQFIRNTVMLEKDFDSIVKAKKVLELMDFKTQVKYFKLLMGIVLQHVAGDILPFTLDNAKHFEFTLAPDPVDFILKVGRKKINLDLKISTTGIFNSKVCEDNKLKAYKSKTKYKPFQVIEVQYPITPEKFENIKTMENLKIAAIALEIVEHLFYTANIPFSSKYRGLDTLKLEYNKKKV